MKEILPPSLLPYLQFDNNPIRLEISLCSREISSLEKTPFPFLLINESTPFERLLEAKIVTDADSDIKRVFLLQQSDDYRHVPDEMWPLTNEDIDQRWRNTFELYSSKSKTGRSNPILLAAQIQKNGEFSQFHQLFYCAFKDVYFHPPCPACGEYLQLCRDDRLLAESHLTPYTTSLQRYLYCPKCLQESGSTQFYTYSHEGNDPATSKDRWDLVNDFGNLILTSGSLDGFPCMKCSETTPCYGIENRVKSRIVPYSFYPFHLLVIEADTLSAPDFLALLSGASFESLKANLSDKKAHGRLRCLQTYEHTRTAHSEFMFGSDSEKGFLEILYLKLSFLGKLIKEFFGNSNRAVYCDAALSLDRVWVRLSDQSGLLPQFWNFNLSILDIWSDSIHQPHLSKYPPAYGHHFLGTVWFHVLLVNDQQSVEKVRAELDKHIQALSAQDRALSEIIQTKGAGTVFAPENIFWNPESKHVGKNWQVLWNKSLDIGGAILAAGFRPQRKWSPDEFWLDYNSLRKDIKSELFGKTLSTIPIEHPSEDAAISDILKRLLARWRSQLKQPESPDADSEADTIILPGQQAAQDLAETVVLSPNALEKDPLSSGLPDDDEETLILPPKNRFPRQGSEIESPDEEIIQETVILSSGNVAPPPRAEWLESAIDQDDLPETVVIKPDALSGDDLKSEAPKTARNQSNQIFRQSDGEKVLPNVSAGKKQDPSPDDDILEETVILRPVKSKGPDHG